MPSLVALQAFTYDKQPLQPGEVFDATDMHAQLLKLMAKAADAPVLHTRALESERPAAPGGKRRYRRRDLRAEP